MVFLLENRSESAEAKEGQCRRLIRAIHSLIIQNREGFARVFCKGKKLIGVESVPNTRGRGVQKITQGVGSGGEVALKSFDVLKTRDVAFITLGFEIGVETFLSCVARSDECERGFIPNKKKRCRLPNGLGVMEIILKGDDASLPFAVEHRPVLIDDDFVIFLAKKGNKGRLPSDAMGAIERGEKESDGFTVIHPSNQLFDALLDPNAEISCFAAQRNVAIAGEGRPLIGGRARGEQGEGE